MKPIDILITHPQKHHIYHLAAGCQRSGLRTRLLVPLYRKGLAALVATLPGLIGRRAQGYYYSELEKEMVISPVVWQAKRLLASSAELIQFQYRFDAYVANLIKKGKLNARVLVTMQDYMPATVLAGKAAGMIIWTEQISNRSEVARARVDEHFRQLGVQPSVYYSEDDNNMILSIADIVSIPSRYTLDGIVGRVSENANVYQIPYGVNSQKFPPRFNRTDNVIKIIARANSIAKGGHLLLHALSECGNKLLDLAGGATIDVIIVGVPDEIIRDLMKNLCFPDGLSINTQVVPHLDMPKLMASSDLFVMPSLSESMSLICIEAMQIGLPMVITSYCGIDKFRHLEMGVEVVDSAESLGNGLIFAFSKKNDWVRWGNAARTAATGLGWNIYEESIAEISRGIL